MFQVGQRVRITAPHILRFIEQYKASPVGTVIAIITESRWPVKVMLDEGKAFSVPHSPEFNFSFTEDGRYDYRSLSADLEVVNV